MKYFKILIIVVIGFGINSCKENSVKPVVDTPPDTTSHKIIWEVDTLGYEFSTIDEVWGTSSDNIYVTGIFYLDNTPGSTEPAEVLMKWDGSKWIDMDFMVAEHVTAIDAIHGINENQICAMGNGNILRASIGDGVNWSTTQIPHNNYLRNINKLWMSQTGKIFSVGYKKEFGTHELSPMAYIYQNGQWTEQVTPGSIPLSNIWGIDDTTVFATGYTSMAEGLFLKYDGNVWDLIYEGVARAYEFSGPIKSVWGLEPDSLYISGYGGLVYGTYNNHKKVEEIVHEVDLNAIYGSSKNNVFVCGDFGVVYHYSGKSWKFYEELYKPGQYAVMSSVWTNGEVVFIVATECNSYCRAIVYRGTIIN